MKNIFSLLLAVALFAACNNNADAPAEGSEDTTTAASAPAPDEALLEEAFPQFYAALKAQDAGFNPQLFVETEGGTGTPSAPRFFAPEELEPFKPYLVYNSDSSKAIDFVTHNYILAKKEGQTVLQPTDADADIAIINMKDNMRTRLFTSRPATVINEGKWLDSATILLGGAEVIEAGRLQPFLLRIDLNKNSVQRFTYTDTLQATIQ